MVEFSKRLEKYASNLHFVEGDFLERKPELGKFDMVVLMYILHDLEPEPFLKRALEVLKPDGTVIITDFNVNELRDRVKRFARGNDLTMIEDDTQGRAHTHEKETDAFLLVMGS